MGEFKRTTKTLLHFVEAFSKKEGIYLLLFFVFLFFAGFLFFAFLAFLRLTMMRLGKELIKTGSQYKRIVRSQIISCSAFNKMFC
ncbi:hypothetical protein A3C37_02455 [Candidatus Peribacteria bacterium RIFCSPHIGHO2_02_FULL_53_20]|nr:MAG: hypothetical protein A3C37_02455 [Candidatus Peribacteria bacterium RIFCSPHIGHO2_02_FULL_53_20]OGJ66423.1 MAG: hypothetical protein A3B61_02455 [Candidatus Peribacteria bacterium RIFCSPLOWO2_01_FULL_53_10]OGJ74424.1 MAG: hypothetical protein A3G69_02505 [Candidatus Peribacteria bacterium RIFCSPLOWO2_12_FULL_53_10]